MGAAMRRYLRGVTPTRAKPFRHCAPSRNKADPVLPSINTIVAYSRSKAFLARRSGNAVPSNLKGIFERERAIGKWNLHTSFV
jgi:hypothetical protein